MASRAKRPRVPRRVGLQATASVTASAKYEVQKRVTEYIPLDVTRAKASAWLTLLSPITQWASLKGDQLAHKRELLRIQQEETLTAILRRAAPRIAQIKPPIQPVPLKFLVPFLENASLEEPQSELVKMWANLLVASAEHYDARFVHYVGIVSQISAAQARLFEAIIGPRGPSSVCESLLMLDHSILSDHIRSGFLGKKARRIESAWEFLENLLNVVGLVTKHMEVGDTKDLASYMLGAPRYSIYTVLEGLGLLRYTDTGNFRLDSRWEAKVMAYRVSNLGLAFAAACGVGTATDDRNKRTAALT